MALWEGKKYKCEKSENFDEYMKALGEFLILIYLKKLFNFNIISNIFGDVFMCLIFAQ